MLVLKHMDKVSFQLGTSFQKPKHSLNFLCSSTVVSSRSCYVINELLVGCLAYVDGENSWNMDSIVQRGLRMYLSISQIELMGSLLLDFCPWQMDIDGTSISGLCHAAAQKHGVWFLLLDYTLSRGIHVMLSTYIISLFIIEVVPCMEFTLFAVFGLVLLNCLSSTIQQLSWESGTGIHDWFLLAARNRSHCRVVNHSNV